MSGQKLFVNETEHMVIVSVKTRRGDDPENGLWGGAGMNLNAGDSKWLSYGNDENPYANEISVKLTIDDNHYECGTRVGTQRGTQADNELNMNNTVVITFEEGRLSFHMTNS